MPAPGFLPASDLPRRIDALRDREHDVLVVGGGINGTGVARDLARRGARVALVEKEDLGYGTTGRSTRLIHGGLRYLALYDFALVRESLREREILLRNAPHLCRPIRFLIPIYEGQRPPGWKLRIGVTLYDLLSYDKSLPDHEWLPKERALLEEPGLNPEGLEGALVYWDGQVEDVERLCFENALDAADHGAIVANHVEVTALAKEGDRVVGVEARDALTGDAFAIRARVVVNAAGPWLERLLPSAEGHSPVRMTKGVHAVVPRHTENAIVLFAEDDRLFFSIPWHDRSLVGTTDTDFAGDLDRLAAEKEEIRYLLASTRRAFPKLGDGVDWTYAGVRSLLNVAGVSEGEVTRRHLVLDHAAVDGTEGIVAIVGGKITPYRLVCEETGDVVARKLGLERASDTSGSPLPGAATPRLSDDGLPKGSAAHLARLYGSRALRVAAMCRAHPSLAGRVCEHGPDLWGAVRFAAQEEMAMTLADALLRRTTVGMAPCRGLHVADAAARFLAPLLSWDEARVAKEVAAYRGAMELRRSF